MNLWEIDMNFRNSLIAAAAVAVTSFVPAMAHAGGIVLSLTRSTLVNVPDGAGLWQHQSGDILKSGVKVGQYALHRRVTNGGTTAPLNTAMTTITLFFATAAGNAPENITVEGAHDFGPGNFRGSVSASSNRFAWIHGADATYTAATGGGETLVLSWTGASQLTLP
jgi:hypothetical protein